jgi:hypothetical protein
MGRKNQPHKIFREKFSPRAGLRGRRMAGFYLSLTGNVRLITVIISTFSLDVSGANALNHADGSKFLGRRQPNALRPDGLTLLVQDS